MKQLFLLNIIFCLVSTANANDLTYSVTNTTVGGNTGSINLTVSGGSAPFTFKWSNSSTTEDISALTKGTYTVTVTDKYCGTATLSIFVDDNVANSINEMDVSSSTSMLVFPNPAQESITINIGNPLKNASFKLINISGQMVMEKPSLTGNSFVIDISNQSAGMYFVEINQGKCILRSKLIIK